MLSRGYTEMVKSYDFRNLRCFKSTKLRLPLKDYLILVMLIKLGSI